MRDAGVLFVGCLWWLGGALGPALAQIATHSSDPPASLVRFLRDFTDDKSSRFFAEMVNLRSAGGQQAVVYLVGKKWCGTAGCPTLILAEDGSRWRLVTKIITTRPPIQVLGSVSNGWHDISVWVVWDDVPGYFAELRFDGKSYPAVPSIPPARRLAGNVEGQVVVPPDAMLTRLYPEGAESSLQLAPGTGPSFNCTKAATRIEKLVCADTELAAVDRTMAAAYRDVLRRVPAGQSPAGRKQQREWLSLYNQMCSSLPSDEAAKACILGFLSARARELASQ